MFGQFHYHSAIRKYIIMFGNMFNDIDVVRFNSAGDNIQQIRVPIAYGPREKFLAKLRTDPDGRREIAMVLPRLSFELTSMNYAPERVLNRTHKQLGIGGGNNSLRKTFTPAPYDLDMSLYAMFANQEDAVQVVEQILPYFRPEWTNSVKIVPELDTYVDVPTILNGMTIEDSYDGDFDQRRAIIYTFTFKIKGYLFGPVTNKGIIRRTLVNTFDPQANTATGNVIISTSDTKLQRLTLTPGLLANGQPTSNSSASIPISQISANSNFGFAFDREDFFN
tara:strand:+ start:5741 stop:6577 length:837 start_codon:yes stop_codon:yes gene_type:complete